MEQVQRFSVEVDPNNDSLFNEVWKLYPRKLGKKVARRKYDRLLKEHSQETLIEAVKNFIEDSRGTEIKFLPHGDKFFSKRYEDYLPDNYEPSNGAVLEKKTFVDTTYEFRGYADYLKQMMTMPYNEYILTEHWKHFRKEAVKFFGCRCQLCNADQTEIHIHHKTYENRGRETFNDVIPLCDKCHKSVHGIS